MNLLLWKAHSIEIISHCRAANENSKRSMRRPHLDFVSPSVTAEEFCRPSSIDCDPEFPPGGLSQACISVHGSEPVVNHWAYNNSSDEIPHDQPMVSYNAATLLAEDINERNIRGDGSQRLRFVHISSLLLFPDCVFSVTQHNRTVLVVMSFAVHSTSS